MNVSVSYAIGHTWMHPPSSLPQSKFMVTTCPKDGLGNVKKYVA